MEFLRAQARLVTWRASCAAMLVLAACSSSDPDSSAAPPPPEGVDPVPPSPPSPGPDAGGEIPVPAYPDLGPSPWHPVGDRWSDPATWGGQVPAEGAHVTIPTGKTVLVDIDVKPGSVDVVGTLLCGEKAASLTTASMMVTGTFGCGTDETPMSNRFVVTLTGARSLDDPMGMGTKVLGAMAGGTIDFHGKPRTSWVRIGETAAAGARSITVERGTDWRPGDRLVIASTDFDMNQAEERAVAAVKGNTLTLDRPLAFLHWGTSQTFSHGAKTWKLDERAEVALLNRPIVIKGDDGSVASAFGGHLMAMRGATLHLDNVELTHMGQRDLLARYPIHWHLAGDVTGQYVKGSSIHHTFNRCITVHGASNALLQANVCYDNPGHAIFLEDGVERGNVIEDNLGLVTRRPATGLRPSDTANRGLDRLGPATFWISNPDNHVRRNVSAGSDGSGFWYGVGAAPGGPSAGVAINPSTTPLTEFDGNLAHSAGGMAMVIGAPRDDGESQHEYRPTATAVFKNSGYYKTRARGVWAHGGNMRFDEFVMADNVRGAFFSYGSELSNSLIVGESENVGTPSTTLEKTLGRSLADPAGIATGYLFYDGPVTFDTVHFAGFARKSDSVYVLANNGAALQAVSNQFQSVSFAADTRDIFPPVFDFGDGSSGAGHGAFTDVDGSVSGKPGFAILPSLAINANANCAQGPWTSKLWMACSPANTYRIMLFTPQFGAGVTGTVQATVTRSDGASHLFGNNGTKRFQMAVIVNQGYRYRYQFKAGEAPTAGTLQMVGEKPGESVVVELVSNPALTTGLPRAASLADLESGAQSRAFVQGGSLFVKLGSAAIGVN